MANYCCVNGCDNNSRKNKMLSFFSIPKDPIRQRQWLMNIGRLDLLSIEPQIVSNRKVCNEHFREEMFAGLGKSRLKKDAFPTIFKGAANEQHDLPSSRPSGSPQPSTSGITSLLSTELSEDSTDDYHLEQNPLDKQFQTSSTLSNTTPRKRSLTMDIKNIKRKFARVSEAPEPPKQEFSEEHFIKLRSFVFCAEIPNGLGCHCELLNNEEDYIEPNDRSEADRVCDNNVSYCSNEKATQVTSIELEDIGGNNDKAIQVTAGDLHIARNLLCLSM